MRILHAIGIASPPTALLLPARAAQVCAVNETYGGQFVAKA